MALLDIFSKTLVEQTEQKKEDLIQEANLSAKQHSELLALALGDGEYDMEDFLEKFDEVFDSAVSIWANPEQRKDLKRLYRMGAKFISISGENDSKTRNAIKKKSKEPGWTLFAEEDNFSSIEAIFYHK